MLWILLNAIVAATPLLSTRRHDEATFEPLDEVNRRTLEMDTAFESATYAIHSPKLPIADNIQDSPALGIRSSQLPKRDFIPNRLTHRSLLTHANFSYGFFAYNVVDMVTTPLKTMKDDLDAAFASYQRASESIHADHQPLFRLSFTLGALQLRLDCPNPMNLDTVKEAVSLATFAWKMFGAFYFRIWLWYVPWGVVFLTLGYLPRQGVQNMIPRADESINPPPKVVPVTAPLSGPPT